MTTKKTETIKLSHAARETFTTIKAAGSAGIAVDTLDGRTMRTLTSRKLIAKVGGSRVKLSKAGEAYAASLTTTSTGGI